MVLKTRLKEVLSERGMTQKELSIQSGIRPNAISEIAKNTRDTINREHIGKIAATLGIKDPNELLYFEE